MHLHPQAVLLPDAVGERVRPVATDHAYDLWRVVTVPFAMPGSVQLAETAAAMAADGTDFSVLAHHGCSVLADSVELAHKRAGTRRRRRCLRIARSRYPGGRRFATARRSA